VTGAVLDNSGTAGAIACLGPGFVLEGLQYYPSTRETVTRRNASGQAVGNRVVNSTSAAGTIAYYKLETGTANAFAQLAVNDNAGTPYWQMACGAGVATNYWDQTTQIWRDKAAAEIFRATIDRVSFAKPIKLASANAAPSENDIWVEGGAIKARLGGVTRTVTVT
jgi:hypothetical protein